MSGLVAETERDRYFKGIYLRAKANVESLLSLRYEKDFQAIAMITRSLFELAVDIRLIDQIPDAIPKIAAFSEIEKLRAARMMVVFTNAHPAASVDTNVHALFIKNNAGQIETEQKKLWGTNGKLKHWSGLNNLRERVAKLGEPFEEVYEVKYPQLSWYTHAAGLTGFDLRASSLKNWLPPITISRYRFTRHVLRTVIEEYRFVKWDSNIHNKMKQAELMPFMDTDEDSEALDRELLG